jgi:hypothetical protein
MRSSRDAALAAVFCVLVIFLAWWWWPRGERLEQPAPQPLPRDIANRPAPVPPKLEAAHFETVKTPEGEEGYAASLSTDQAARLKKGQVLTIRGPGGGVITVTPLDDSTKKSK